MQLLMCKEFNALSLPTPALVQFMHAYFYAMMVADSLTLTLHLFLTLTLCLLLGEGDGWVHKLADSNTRLASYLGRIEHIFSSLPCGYLNTLLIIWLIIPQ